MRMGLYAMSMIVNVPRKKRRRKKRIPRHIREAVKGTDVPAVTVLDGYAGRCVVCTLRTDTMILRRDGEVVCDRCYYDDYMAEVRTIVVKRRKK